MTSSKLSDSSSRNRTFRFILTFCLKICSKLMMLGLTRMTCPDQLSCIKASGGLTLVQIGYLYRYLQLMICDITDIGVWYINSRYLVTCVSRYFGIGNSIQLSRIYVCNIDISIFKSNMLFVLFCEVSKLASANIRGYFIK